MMRDHERTDPFPFLKVALLTLAVLLATVCVTLSFEGVEFDLSWFTVDGGGGQASGGQFNVMGTIGQPESVVMTGDEYELLGGFWEGGMAEPNSSAGVWRAYA